MEVGNGASFKVHSALSNFNIKEHSEKRRPCESRLTWLTGAVGQSRSARGLQFCGQGK